MAKKQPRLIFGIKPSCIIIVYAIAGGHEKGLAETLPRK